MNIGKVIRELRIKKGITQVELSTMTGLSQASICRIEKMSGDGKALRSTTLKNLAECLGVSVDYLVGKTTDMKPSEIVGASKGALSVLENFESLTNPLKAIAETFIESMMVHQKMDTIDRVKKREAEFEKMYILWEILEVHRHSPSEENDFCIKYDCTVQLNQTTPDLYLDLKKKKGRNHVTVSGDTGVINKIVTGSASCSKAVAFNLNEIQILSEAIEKATDIAFKKISGK